MPRVQFSCQFRELELQPNGADAVAFYLSANAGEALKPLSKVASGGELARIMLSMKNVLAEKDQIATLIFDEVDTGVSGRAAQKVAEKLFLHRNTVNYRIQKIRSLVSMDTAIQKTRLLLAFYMNDVRPYL